MGNFTAFILISRSTTCFSQIYSLDINVEFVDSAALDEMAQICKALKILIIDACYQDIPGLISLIDAQRKLKSVNIYSNSK